MKRTSFLSITLCLALAAVPGVAQYCTSTSTYTNCVNAEEYIANVTIDTLNNSSACINAPAYEDHTALPGPTLTQASGTAITVTVGNWYSSFDSVTVFCDWNANNVLNDAGEIFPLLQGVGVSGGNTLYTGTITPPVGAAASTRMRVKTVYGSSGNPCNASANWSNTEDYTISTLPPTGLVAVGSASPSPVAAGSPTLFTVVVSATAPPSPPTGVSVMVDLSLIGGSPFQPLYDDGVTGGDATAGDNTFSWTELPATNGTFLLSYSAVDGVPRTANGTISLGVTPSNDACIASIVVGLGANGPFNNLNATDSGVIGSCGTGYKDLWFTFTPPCSGPYHIDTCGPALFDTVLSVYGTCGGGEVACNEDGGTGCGFTSDIASVTLTAGLPIFIRVASYSSSATGSWILNINQVFTTTWTSPLGPGSIKFDLTGGPMSGTYFHAITFVPGLFPGGWFYGIDITFPEIINLITIGPPFVGPLDFCGNVSVGPFVAAPLSGLTIYSVSVASPGATLLLPNYVSDPVTYTIP